jgi:Serine/Threonine/Tyrosine Kinase found in polyvalent proteins
MSHHHPIVTENTSRLSDVAFREALNESARGLASVSGGHDYSKDSWIPFPDRLKVFRKSSRQKIRPIQKENALPDALHAGTPARRSCPISETPTLGGDDTTSLRLERRQRQAQELVTLIQTVSKAIENYPDVFNAEAEFNPAGASRAAEECALSAHAVNTRVLLDPIEFFTRWRDSGANGGQEHQVIVGDEGEPVEKRTNIPYFHDSWAGYFDRIRLHNILFPEATISIKGFQNQERQLGTPYGDVLPSGIYCVIEQPFVNWEREATPEEIRTYLGSGGFVQVPVLAGEKDTGEWYNPKAGIHLVDVRGDNIVMARGDDDLLRPVALDVPTRISHPERDAESRRRVERRIVINRLLI